jgi:hypothetical protein
MEGAAYVAQRTINPRQYTKLHMHYQHSIYLEQIDERKYSYSPVQLTMRKGEGGGRGAESYDHKKAWASINCSIFSDLNGCFDV